MGLGDAMMDSDTADSMPDPDTAGSVQSSQGAGFQNANPGGLGRTLQKIEGSGAQITGPNAAAYNAQMGQANAAGGSYAGLSQGAGAYTQSAPTIANPYQGASQASLATGQANQAGLANYYQGVLNGTGPTVAQNQYQQSLGQSIQANMAMANSTRGGPAALAGAQRAAQEGNAQTMAGAAAQSGIIRAQEQQAAAAGQSGLYGQMGQQNLAQYQLEQQNAQQQAQLQSTNQAQQNAMQLGYGGLGVQEQGLGQQALQNYTTQSLGAQQLQLQSEAQTASQGAQAIGGIGGFVENIASDVGKAYGASDRRLKGDVHDEGNPDSLVDDFLRKMDPKSFRYRAGLDPDAAPVGGRRLGVMAQDMERSPMGREIVHDTPQGKMVDVWGAASAGLASVARLDERMRALEAQRGKR